MLDRGNRAFVDVQAHSNTILGQLLCRGGNTGVITALANVGAQNLQLQPLKRGALEHLPLFQAGAGQGIHQNLGFDVFIAFDFNRRDGGALLNRENQYATFATGLNIGKQSASEQFLDGTGQRRFIKLLANVDWEC